jgi:hypothetical protein
MRVMMSVRSALSCFGGPFGGIGRGDAFDVAAIFQIVARRLGMLGDQFQHDRRKHVADDIGDERAAAVARDEQAAAFQILDRLAQHRARYIELARSSRSPGSLSPTRSTPSSTSVSICAHTSSAVRT